MKYEVGDEVLVRAKVRKELDHCGGHLLSFKTGNDPSYALCIPESQIYSKAPPFEIGEEIEARAYENHGDWEECEFMGYDPTRPYGYLGLPTGVDGSCVKAYAEARKLKPKDEPVTAEELQDYMTDNGWLDSIPNLVKHFSGRRFE